MSGDRIRAVEFNDVWVVEPMAGLGPPEGSAPPVIAAAVGAAIIIGMLAATGLLLWAPAAGLRLRVGVLIIVAGLFGASLVLTATLTPTGGPAWLMPMLWLLLALAVVSRRGGKHHHLTR